MIRRDGAPLLSPPHVLWAPSPVCLLQLGVLWRATVRDRGCQNSKGRSSTGWEELVVLAKKELGIPMSLGYSTMRGPEAQKQDSGAE